VTAEYDTGDVSTVAGGEARIRRSGCDRVSASQVSAGERWVIQINRAVKERNAHTLVTGCFGPEFG
jgi:hypothetical protein